MTNISQELLHELLQRFHQRIDGTEVSIRDLKSENNSIRRNLASQQGDIANFYELLHRIDERLDRIERRLDLRGFSEAAQAVFKHE
jgi:chromosome segregation ATPase